MKVIVDKLPDRKEDCIFCLIGDEKWHKCLFQVNHNDTQGLVGISLSIDNCYLDRGKKCPYLKKLFSQEDNDVAMMPITISDKGEVIGL